MKYAHEDIYYLETEENREEIKEILEHVRKHNKDIGEYSEHFKIMSYDIRVELSNGEIKMPSNFIQVYKHHPNPEEYEREFEEISYSFETKWEMKGD